MKTTAALAALAAVLTLTACAGTGTPAPTPSVAKAYTPSPGYTKPPQMPDTTSSIPDGVYRTRVLAADVEAKGGPPSDAGTWTMTLAHHTYVLECEWTDESGSACGGTTTPNGVVEAGPVRGDTAVVWFAPDLAAVAKLDNCTGSDCGQGATPDPYRMEWKSTGDSLVFTNFIGYGAEAVLMTLVNNFTFQPWTKIG
jgi:hypothetical protein